MVIIDNALAKRQEDNNPIKVAMVGAGFMAQGIALQICNYVVGMKLVAIANRTVTKAIDIYNIAGIQDVYETESVIELENNLQRNRVSVTDDYMLLCKAEGIDAIIEVTGAVEYGAHVAINAIRNGKHIIMMNAEVDGTVGPILKLYADNAGVVYTNADGDQPGVTMNLYRFVKSMGVKPVLCGNIKGLHDPYRNPTTQKGFAEKWGQNPSMVTSFADGSKISFEQAIVANGTAMSVLKRGMIGPSVAPGTPLKDIIQLYPEEELLNGNGYVDYVVGAEPAPGVFILGTHDHPLQKHYLNLYKLGEGPLYLFYTPYHLCHFEVPQTVARAVLFQDAALKPIGRPYVEVITAAKRDLHKGEMLDGIGHYMTYGLCENISEVRKNNLLPIGISQDCKLVRSISKDELLTYDDVVLPENRIIDSLRQEQENHFFGNKNKQLVAISKNFQTLFS